MKFKSIEEEILEYINGDGIVDLLGFRISCRKL